MPSGAMTFSAPVAGLAVVAAGVAVLALGLLHILKPEIPASQAMISQYARGRYGWVMALCFAAFGVASAAVFAALIPQTSSLLARIGLAFQLAAAAGLVMAARIRARRPRVCCWRSPS